MKMQPLEFYKGFVLNPDEFYSPSFRISPFRTEDVSFNLQLPRSNIALELLDRRFVGRNWSLTECGKEGIALSLKALELKPEDCVTIITTTGNLYISGCVTREIEKVCKWSRKIQDNTAAIFVNHEFGYPYRALSELRSYGFPIIEDACHSYMANTPAGDMGHVGDFIIFSLPKVFPLQIGGILSFDSRYSLKSSVKPESDLETYLLSVMSHYIPTLEHARNQRLSNYHWLAECFSKVGCSPRFELLTNDVPSVFIFTVPLGVDLVAMKQHGRAHGIECSVFYGEQTFFIPLHQSLSKSDLDYFFIVFSSFILRH